MSENRINWSTDNRRWNHQ